MAQEQQYDAITTQYKNLLNHGYYGKLLFPTFYHLLGDVKDKKVLDLACGEGYHSRRIKELGASKVVGADISEGMIKLANQAKGDLDIKYIQANVIDPNKWDEFDIVTGSCLLNYASTKEELLKMAQTIRANLKPGGTFVGITHAITTPSAEFAFYVPHGITITVPENPKDGAPITLKFNLPAQASIFQMNYFWMSAQTYEWAFKTAGFEHFEWHPTQVYGCSTPETPEEKVLKESLKSPAHVGIKAW